jgi:hypothetical protein
MKPQIPAACELITKTPARPAPRKGFWVAVPPFKYTGGSAHLTVFSYEAAGNDPETDFGEINGQSPRSRLMARNHV